MPRKGLWQQLDENPNKVAAIGLVPARWSKANGISTEIVPHVEKINRDPD
jgi:hypothetical protein